MSQILYDYYRIPNDLFGSLSPTGGPPSDQIFEFGSKIVHYKKCSPVDMLNNNGVRRTDPWEELRGDGSEVNLPLCACQVIEGLQREHYVRNGLSDQRIVNHALVRSAYYFIRELLPTSVRRRLQRTYLSDWQTLPFPSWPVDFTVDDLQEQFLGLSMQLGGVLKVPFIWFWPEAAANCLIMTHDVETAVGRDFCSTLMDLDDSYGIKASFQSVPEKRYDIPDEYVHEIRSRGFEFNIHDLNHDGYLFQERKEFLSRAKKINEYVRRYNSRGFRAGAMYRNQDWFDAFEFSYDMSVPNIAHLEPQRGGCCTVMPFFIGKILELPLTTTQDYSLFHVLNEHSIELWKKQLSLLRHRNGLMSFVAHPDYLIDRNNRRVFESLLEYLQQMIVRENIWSALPRDVDHWWRARNQMKLVRVNNVWEIEGPEKERARLAYAVLNDSGRISYEVAGKSVPDSVRQSRK